MLSSRLSRFVDVRPGEWRVLTQAFAVLLLIVAGHTVLEAARDALLLTEMAARSLGGVYLAMAVVALPAGALIARVNTRLGAQRTLAATTATAAVAAAGFFFLPATPGSAFALYVTTGLIGALVVPQFWALAGQLFTVAQGRRLLGTVAAAGLLGGVIGSGLAAAALMVTGVRTLLVLSASLFLVAGAAASVGIHEQASIAGAGATKAIIPKGATATFREEPFVRRIALLVALATGALLVIDYLFKWTVAHTVPAAELGSFFARTYTLLNVLSVLVQLFVGAALVKRLGVAAAAGVTPFFLLLGAGASLLAGGALVAVLVLKGIDGSLRHSLHRVTTELLYFPLARSVRERVKPFIDGALARMAQAVTAAVLLGVGEAGMLTTTRLTVLAALLILAWLVVAGSLRRSYLAALRRTLAAGALEDDDTVEELDLASVEVLVERLASADADDVVAALRVLSLRKRERLIPALVLYHPDAAVVIAALEIFAASPRRDWVQLGERLLDDPRAKVRVATAHALARHGMPETIARLARDPSPHLQAYAAIFIAAREAPEAVLTHPGVAALLAAGSIDPEVMTGLLDALADAPQLPGLGELLAHLAERARDQDEHDDAIARAAERQAEPRLIPELLGRLDNRAGREHLRRALALLGRPAQETIIARLGDHSQPVELRKNLPQTLARFGTQRAADFLLLTVEADPHGLVRYNALRGLGRMVVEHDIRVDRTRVERMALRNLAEHLRLMGLKAALGELPGLDAECGSLVGQLLVGLIDDKRDQALERAFRLIKVAHRREDLQRVHWAVRSGDARARANAAEFLDTLLARSRDRQPLRQLFQVALDDASTTERLRPVSGLLGQPVPESRNEALLALMDDGDDTLAALGAYYAATLEDRELGAAAQQTYIRRPRLEAQALGFLRVPMPSLEGARA